MAATLRPPAGALGALLALPFDGLRFVHATNVQLGLAPRSMLWSREFERGVCVLEQLMLGPLARSA